MRKLLIIAGLALAFAAAQALALTDEEMSKVHAMLTEQLKDVYWQHAIGPDGKKLVMPANEKDIYTIPVDEEKAVIVKGMNAAKYEWCGLDAERYFAATMAQRKASGKWNDYQLSYISLLQSSGIGFAQVPLKDKECTKDIRKEVEALYKSEMKGLEGYGKEKSSGR